MSEPQGQLVHMEGNAGKLDIISPDALPAILRGRSGTPLDAKRQGLVFNRRLAPNSVTIGLGAAMLFDVLSPDEMIAVAHLTAANPGVRLRIIPEEVRVPYPFVVCNDPPAGADAAVFIERTPGDVVRETDPQAIAYHQRVMDMAMTHALPHDTSVTLLHSMGGLLTKAG